MKCEAKRHSLGQGAKKGASKRLGEGSENREELCSGCCLVSPSGGVLVANLSLA